jgi:predicted TIM-barrel fold metal-dependent hydrolase
MPDVTRRSWLRDVGLVIGAAAGASARARVEATSFLPGAQQPAAAAPKPPPVSLLDFQPRSMLHVSETRVDRPRFPAIDIHTHLSLSRRDGAVRYTATADELLPVMDRHGVRTMVNLTGGTGTALANTIARFDRAHPGRFLTFTEPSWSRVSEPGYPAFQADEIAAAKRAGARGVKVLKLLGLYLREGGPDSPLVKIDDPRFDPMWEACGAAGLPVAIHVSDPEAFFLPVDRFNERYEELYAHPDWSFHGPQFPSHQALLEACDRVFARHPKTQFLALHVGHNAENLSVVSARLDRFPNMTVELGARIGELGRQPRTARAFFEKYQDRILFGTDAVPQGTQTPQQVFGDELYPIYYRFLETEDEYFDYAPAPVPPQGRWRIYGLGLPETILRKVYADNAVRLLGLSASDAA